MKTNISIMLIVLLSCISQSQVLKAQLPSWPIVTGSYQYSTDQADKKPAQVIHWLGATPIITTIPAATSNTTAPAAPGYDACGKMEFYVLHNGLTTNNNLFIYDPEGNPLYPPAATPGTGLNASNGDVDIQVISVPGIIDKWYIIYNFNIPNDQYKPSKIGYSILTHNPDGTWDVLPSERDIPITTANFLYNKGKALSKPFANMHFLYLCRRLTDNWGNIQNFFIIDKYSLTTTGINLVESSLPIYEPWWPLSTIGSPIELNNDGSLLAMLLRTQDNMNVYFFNSSNFADYSRIPIKDLIIENGLSAEQLAYFGTYPWLRNFHRKMHSIEFSPNGKYLFMAAGGYSGPSYINLTYLVQIGLPFAPNVPQPPLQATLQTQEVAGWDNPSYAVYFSSIVDPVYWENTQLIQLQSSLDGNIYFTKSSRDILYVIPNPDSPMPNDIIPHNINMATSIEPNFQFDGYVHSIPDQIDGYDYLTNSYGETPTASISVNPEYPVNPGGNHHTIYIGYGPQNVTLNGSGGIYYSWTSDPVGFTSLAQNPSVSPSETTTYYVEVRNEHGCSAIASETIYVEDIRCGKDKVNVCHNDNNWHTICVSVNAVPAHLAHGDYLGSCDNNGKFGIGEEEIGTQSATLAFSPNPLSNSAHFTLEVFAPEIINIYIVDIFGKLVANLMNEQKTVGTYTFDFDASDLPPGVYYCHLMVGNEITTIKLVIVR